MKPCVAPYYPVCLMLHFLRVLYRSGHSVGLTESDVDSVSRYFFFFFINLRFFFQILGWKFWYLTQASESDQNWPHEQSDPVTAKTRLNWSNAEGKGSMQHGEIIKVAYRAPAAQDCNPPFP